MYYRLMGLCLLALLGCGPKKVADLAEIASRDGNWDEAYLRWSEVLEKEPGDTKARVEQERARLQAALNHLWKAGRYFEKGQLKESEYELQLTLGYDPDNQEAVRIQDRIEEQRLREEREARAESQPRKRSNLPRLRPNTWDPQDLVFINQTIKDIYQSLGQAYEVNIVVDQKIRNDKITLDLRNLNFIKALDTLMVLNRHFFKIIDDNTIIILEDNKNNRDRYDNQVIQTFYLSNITPKEIKNHLRILLDIKEFAENEALNAITIKGTPEQLALAEKIIATNDKEQAEVVIEIELLEVSKNNMRKFGLLPVSLLDGSPSYQAGVVFQPENGEDDNSDRGSARGFPPNINSGDLITLLPAIAVDFLRESGGSKQVANPQLRLTSGVQGNIRIGQSIPVLQTSFTNAQISGSASGGDNSFGDNALSTFNYNDIGINISLTPRVHYNNEITLNLELEMSSVVTGGFQPILGRRNVTTTLRLKNGETNVLAGLLTNEERKSLRGIIGLSDIPILGRLFSNDEKVINQTDIVMMIRPVIVRGPKISDEDRAPYELSSLKLSTLYGEDMPETAKAPRRPINRSPAASSTNIPRQHSEVYDPGARMKTNEPEPEEDSFEELDEPAPAMLSFSPISAEGRQDDVIEFQLFITNVEAMKRGQLALTFDPNVLQAESVEIGDFFDAQNKRPLLTPDWNNKTGRIALVITQRDSGDPFSGSGILAMIRFRAKATGAGDLVLEDIKLETADGRVIPTQGLNGGYEVFP